MTAYLAVARFRKPHGMKGEAVVIPLTDEPERVFEVGRCLTPLDDAGVPNGAALQIVRSRPFHRQWLLQFEGLSDRGELERWPKIYLGLPETELDAPGDGEMYVHEIPGAEVSVGGEVIGTARGLIDVPAGGQLLNIDMDGRDVMVPFKKPILIGLDRKKRRIEIDPPPGLLDI